MVSRYAVYGFLPGKEDGREVMGEFERLETAMDFVEFYRRKYNRKIYRVCGITYNRTNENEGRLISEWKPIPDQLREEACEDFITYLQADPE